MKTLLRSRSLLLGLALAAAPASLLRADFSGDYSVGSSGNYNLVSGVSTSFGDWTGKLTTSGAGGSGSINTSSAPGSLTLSTTGNANAGTGSVVFSYASFETAGVVSFSFTGSLSVTLDNVTKTPTGSAYSFAVDPGQTLAFKVTATGTTGFSMPGYWDPMTMTMIGGFNMPGVPMSNSATISNFTAPVSAVPEPSTYAALVGGAGLAFAAIRRRRRG